MTPAPGEVFAGFIIERELGSGGMGVVYLARHPRLPRRVALKLLRTDLGSDPSFVGRFHREAETVARLDHPNIVSIDDSGAQDGQLWISMRFVDGTTASEALAAYDAGMPPERAVHIIEKVAAALDFAHRHRVVHRDVKPANILLTDDPDEPEERVFLTDFGVAKAMDEIEAQATSLTAAGGVVATLDYAAPEQIEAKPLDGRCDVFALGCVLYKLLTGVIPYPGENLAAKVYTRMHQPPPRPTDLAPALPAAFDTVIATALARDPDDRYQTCKALAIAARAALTGVPPVQTATVGIMPPGPDLTQAVPGGPRQGGPAAPGPPTGPPRTGPPAAGSTHVLSPPEYPARRQQQPGPPPQGPPPQGPQGPPTGYTSPDSLPPELAELLGPGMHSTGGAADPDEHGVRRNRTRRRSLAAIGVVVLVAAVVIGISLVHRGQVAGDAKVGSRTSPAVGSGTLGAGPAGGSTAGTSSAARTSGPVTAAPVTAATSLPAVAGLPHSDPLPPGTLVVSRKYGTTFALYRIDTTTGKVVGKAITPTAPDGQNPLVSRQRGSIIYLQADTTGNTVRTVAADGTGDRLLFPRPAGCSSIGRPAWDQADPQLLAVNCGIAGGPVTLQIVDLTGRVRRNLSTGLAIVDDLSFSPDGTKILYWGSTNRKAGDGGLFVQAVDGLSAPARITPADSHDADCDFSPDGTRITFRRVMADGTGSRPHIAMIDAAGSTPPTVFDESGQGPVWSPDGQQIAYKADVATTDGRKKSEILVLTVASPGSPRQMAAGDTGSVSGSPIWGPR